MLSRIAAARWNWARVPRSSRKSTFPVGRTFHDPSDMSTKGARFSAKKLSIAPLRPNSRAKSLSGTSWPELAVKG